MSFKRLPLLICLILLVHFTSLAQPKTDSLSGNVTLEQCIAFALKNQPAVQQSLIDEEIGERNIRLALSDWYPQVRGEANLSSYLKESSSNLAPRNSSNFLIQGDQAIFNNDLLLASKAQGYDRTRYKQNTESNKINTVIYVSKAYYDILTSLQQITILNQVIARVDKQYKDSFAQYDAGLVDKTDYKRASIALSNSKADLKRITESLKYKYAFLRQLMGYPAGNDLNLQFNNVSLEQEVLLDTTQRVNYESRIEYRQLQTEKQIQNLTINYYKYGFLPSVSAFVNYNLGYQNNRFGNVYSQSFPNSQTGLKLAIPIFQGSRRLQNMRREQLEDKRLDLDILDTKNAINTQYQQALASYKSNLNDWRTIRENVVLSEEVYNTIKLQYNEGIKTYLEVMIAESDLRTTQLNYQNALFSVLSSKLDVQRSLGTINVNK
ncbi:MAG TPA: TolC family protein [Sphingobacteriaceae bacterium]|nr:TolC family protein [Sphingobacteriaceae bacterium]